MDAKVSKDKYSVRWEIASKTVHQEDVKKEDVQWKRKSLLRINCKIMHVNGILSN